MLGAIRALVSGSQAEGRRFEPGLALQGTQASSRSYASGLFHCGSPFRFGAAGVPFAAAVGTIEAAEHRDDVDRVAGLHLVRALHGVGRDHLVALVGRLRPRKLAAAPTPAKLPVPPVHWRRAP